jgi:hypothetical protein
VNGRQYLGLVLACSFAAFIGSCLASSIWFNDKALADIATGNGGGLSSVSVANVMGSTTDPGSGLCGTGISTNQLSICNNIQETVTVSNADLLSLDYSGGAGSIENSNTNTTYFDCSTTSTNDCYTFEAPAGTGNSATFVGPTDQTDGGELAGTFSGTPTYSGAYVSSGSPTYTGSTLLGLARTGGAGTITNSNTHTTNVNCSTTSTTNADCYTFAAPSSGTGSSLSIDGPLGFASSASSLAGPWNINVYSSNAANDQVHFNVDENGGCSSSQQALRVYDVHNSQPLLSVFCAAGGTDISANGGDTSVGTSGSGNLLLLGTSNDSGEVVTGGASEVTGAPGTGAAVLAGHLDQDTTCTSSSGTFEIGCVAAMTAGSVTISFAKAFANTPICTASDRTAIHATQVQPSTSSVTVQGTSTDTIQVICVGNPN